MTYPDPTRPWWTLFADSDTGRFTLPDAVADARAALKRIADHIGGQPPAPDPATIEQSLRADVEAAARTGAAWPSLGPVAEAEQSARLHTTGHRLLEGARDHLTADLAGTVAEHADVIVTDHLRPVFTAAVATIHKAADVLPTDFVNVDQLLNAPAAARKAWGALGEATHTLAKCYDHAHRLQRNTPPHRDINEEFASMKNKAELWPSWRGNGTPPWHHADARQVRLNQIRLGVQLWLPTSAERDQAWLAAHRDQVEQTSANSFALAGFRAAFGG